MLREGTIVDASIIGVITPPVTAKLLGILRLKRNNCDADTVKKVNQRFPKYSKEIYTPIYTTNAVDTDHR